MKRRIRCVTRTLICIISILILVLSQSFCLQVKADPSFNLGNLNYWCSDDNTIGRWGIASIVYYRQKLNNNSSFDFISAFDSGIGSWNQAITSKSISSTNNSSSYSVIFVGGTKSEVTSYFTDFSGLTTSHTGLTSTQFAQEGTWYYQSPNGSVAKQGKLMISAHGCVIDKNRTHNQYIKTCTHEIGHSLGWFGHSPVSTDIMYSSGSSITSLTNRDKNHLVQVY